jgi:hypothetical protein
MTARLFARVTLGLALLPSSLLGQGSRYEPSYERPTGAELVAVFVGSSRCVANAVPGFLASIDPMNRLLAQRARLQGRRFVAVGVTTDWEPDSGFAYLKGLSEFDEVAVGRNWYSNSVAHYIWSDSATAPVEPQVILIERTFDAAGPRPTMGPERVIGRWQGADDIMAWVHAGVPYKLVD